MRSRQRGYRLPPGAVYVGRPSLFGNPWSPSDAPREVVLRDHEGQIVEVRPPSPRERAAWCVARYREELGHFGMLSDWGGRVSDARWREVDALVARPGCRGMADLARHLLRHATALACWCSTCPAHADGLPGGVACEGCAPCHGDVLAGILEAARCPSCGWAFGHVVACPDGRDERRWAERAARVPVREA